MTKGTPSANLRLARMKGYRKIETRCLTPEGAAKLAERMDRSGIAAEIIDRGPYLVVRICE